MKINEKQQQILDKMSDGWQLGQSTGMNCRYWLQFGGCGRGGKTEDVNANTVLALRSRNLIEIDELDFPIQTFRLSRSEQSTTAKTSSQNER